MERHKPNKIQTVKKRPTATMKSRVGTYTGRNNKGKAFGSIKVSMKGRLK